MLKQNKRAKFFHDFESPLLYKVVHVAVTKIHAKPRALSSFGKTRWRPQCPDKGTRQITSFVFSKFNITKTGICRNDKFD